MSVVKEDERGELSVVKKEKKKKNEKKWKRDDLSPSFSTILSSPFVRKFNL